MASGNTLAIFSPVNNEPPVSNFATPDDRNANPLLDFNDTINKSAVFSTIMPQHYDGGGITVYVHYQMTSATSGDVDIDGQFERNEDGANMTSDGFAAAQSIDNTTVPGTAGIKDVISIPFTNGAQIDNIVAGDEFRFKLTRDAVSDTANGDLELRKIELRET